MNRPGALTPTSFAILGLLALRDWTTYELAQQMELALGRFWPRTRSKLYEEPKKLVALGLARAAAESVGGRRRTRYAITPKGRRVLATWVPARGAGPQLEFESLIKVFFAEHGTKSDLLATLQRARDWAREQAEESVTIPEDYMAGLGSFSERLPMLILTGKLLHEFQRTIDDWAAWAIDMVNGWPENLSEAEPDWDTLEQLAVMARTLRDGGTPRSRAGR